MRQIPSQPSRKPLDSSKGQCFLAELANADRDDVVARRLDFGDRFPVQRRAERSYQPM
jgi:hypothetical protein